MLIYPWGTNSFSSYHRASRCHHLVTDILASMWDKSWRCYWKEKTKGALILTAARQNFCILFWQTLKNRLRRGRIFIFLLESHTLKNSKPALELKPWEGTWRGPRPCWLLFSPYIPPWDSWTQERTAAYHVLGSASSAPEQLWGRRSRLSCKTYPRISIRQRRGTALPHRQSLCVEEPVPKSCLRYRGAACPWEFLNLGASAVLGRWRRIACLSEVRGEFLKR